MTFRKEVDRFLDRIREGDAFDLLSSSDWIPNMDFAEKADVFMVKLEVPGIEPKDIEVLYQNGLLTIRGEKKSEIEEKDARYYRTERSYGSFARSFSLPNVVDTEKIKAEYKDGVLNVTLPTKEEAKPKQITINVSR